MASQYTVVSSEDKLERLIEEVNKRMADGWQLIGGISVSLTFDAANEQMYQMFAQALIKVS